MIQSKPNFMRPFVTMMSVVAFVITIVPVHAHSDRPESFADLAEQLSPAVVNISTTTVIENNNNFVPQFPPGSPLRIFWMISEIAAGNAKLKP